MRAQSLSRVRLCATLWTVARQAPLSMGFSRQEYSSELPCPPPGDLPNPGIEPRSPALQALPNNNTFFQNLFNFSRRPLWLLLSWCHYCNAWVKQARSVHANKGVAASACRVYTRTVTPHRHTAHLYTHHMLHIHTHTANTPHHTYTHTHTHHMLHRYTYTQDHI